MKVLHILCVCEHGNVRSVALAYLLKTIYDYDALACGVRETEVQTKEMLYQWADRIIFLDKELPEYKLLVGSKTFPYKNKVQLIDIGKDVWYTAKHPELLHKLMKQLKTLNL